MITLRIGQAVGWPHSPSGIAQIDSLGRKRVRLVYQTKRGTLRFPTIPASAVRTIRQPILPIIVNPLSRGIPKRCERDYPQ